MLHLSFEIQKSHVWTSSMKILTDQESDDDRMRE